MPVDETDRLLVARIRVGENRAWQECIDRFEGRLLAYVDSRLRNRATSEDVVQETFVGFMTGLPNYDDERTPLDTYLFSIASFKLIDVMRRDGRRPTLPLARYDSQGKSIEPKGNGRKASSMMRSSEGKTAQRVVISDCLNELIERWIERKEFERLMCIELLFAVGASNKDVAIRLGISEQAVANHKHFVVNKLREAGKNARLRDFDPGDFGIR